MTVKPGYRVAAVVAVAALLLSGCEWASFRNGPTRTGFNAAESNIGVGNVASLTEKWTGVTDGQVWSSPAVTGGVAYVGSDDGKLYAFNAAGATGCSGTPKTCQPLWTGATGNFVRSSPAIAGGVV